MDPSYVYSVCNIRNPSVFRSGFLGINTEAGVCIYHILETFIILQGSCLSVLLI